MDKINLLIGTTGIVAANIPSYIESLPQIVSIVCSAVIAISTCALQIYYMWKNRDKYKPPEISAETGAKTDTETDGNENG